MKLKASILFAFRMLRPRSGVRTSAGRSLLGAVFCIGLSLVPLVVVLTVSDGMIEGITERIIGLSSYHMRVSVRKGSPASESIEAMESLAQEISETEGVVSAYAERQGVALAAGSTGRVGATVRAVPSEIFAEGSDFSSLFFTEDGNLSLPTKRSALIGKKIAQSLSVKAGDSIRLVTFKTGTNGKLIPRISTFTVEGIVSCGYQELDALWIFIPFDTGYSLLSDSMSNLFVGIQTEDAFSESLIKTAYDIEKELPVGCRLYMWDELNTAQYENFASTKIMLIFVMFLIVLVASVNISSALVMISMERRREIAILKSMGATSSGITVSFLFTGFCTGALGILIGMPVGILCALNVNAIISFMEDFVNILARLWHNFVALFSSTTAEYMHVYLLDPEFYLDHIPVVLPVKQLFLIAGVTLFLSVVVSALPSIRAGKEKPIDTLRKV